MSDLAGQVAIVTGGASGIGRAIALLFASKGCRVVIADQDARRGTEVADELKRLGSTDSSSTETDVSSAAQVDALVTETLTRFGRLDILVNSAGMARHSPAVNTTPEDYDAAMNLNLRAAYFLTREVAKGLIAAGRGGSLINLSSQMGHVAGPDRAVYAANKHALEGMTKAMAIEWGPNAIRVNTLCPTFIRTPLAEQTLAIPERRAWILSKIKLGRVGEVEDLMGPIVFLASDASALMTGTHLIIDGGWTAE